MNTLLLFLIGIPAIEIFVMIKIGQNISLNDKVVQKFEVALKKLCLKMAEFFPI